jgi:hypothetical protein
MNGTRSSSMQKLHCRHCTASPPASPLPALLSPPTVPPFALRMFAADGARDGPGTSHPCLFWSVRPLVFGCCFYWRMGEERIELVKIDGHTYSTQLATLRFKPGLFERQAHLPLSQGWCHLRGWALCNWSHGLILAAAFGPQQAPPMIMDQDFGAYGKVSVHNSGYNSSTLPSKFSVKEYCPIVFRDLRERFEVDAEHFMHSFCAEVGLPFSLRTPASGTCVKIRPSVRIPLDATQKHTVSVLSPQRRWSAAHEIHISKGWVVRCEGGTAHSTGTHCTRHRTPARIAHGTALCTDTLHV